MLLILFLLIGINKLTAQSTSIPNVLKLKSVKSRGVILDKENVIGYYLFYYVEKKDKKNSTYELSIYDNKYNKAKSITLTRPKHSNLLEIAYNGNAFMLFFYNYKIGYEFLTYNRKGELLGEITIPKKEIPYYDWNSSATNIKTGLNSTTIYPMGENGFVRQSFTKNKKQGYSLIAYDNELKKLWSHDSPNNSKLIQTAEISGVSDDIITATIYLKKSVLTKKFDNEFLILNAHTGKVIKKTALGSNEKGKRFVLKTKIDKENEKIILIGEYFKPGDNVLKDKSQGIYSEAYSFGGEHILLKKYSWKTDIDRFKKTNLTAEEQKEAKSSFSLMFHNVIRTKSGHLFLVAEQFRKQVSAGGVAMNALAAASNNVQSNAANFEVRISNIVIIQLDDAFNLLDYKIIKKKRTSVFLPEGAGMWSSAYLGYYVNSMGGFDYSYTSSDVENNEYQVVYIDANKKEKKGAKRSDVMVGVIDIKNDKLSNSRIPLNIENRKFWINRAYHGYISITEYDKANKKLNMRIEKLSY